MKWLTSFAIGVVFGMLLQDSISTSVQVSKLSEVGEEFNREHSMCVNDHLFAYIHVPPNYLTVFPVYGKNNQPIWCEKTKDGIKYGEEFDLR